MLIALNRVFVGGHIGPIRGGHSQWRAALRIERKTSVIQAIARKRDRLQIKLVI
jgi:hypothetical protein